MVVGVVWYIKDIDMTQAQPITVTTYYQSYCEDYHLTK